METSITLQVCLDLVERKMESSQKGIRLKKVCRRSHFPSELLSREGHDSECLKRTCEMEKDSELQGDKSPKEPFIGVPIEQVEAKENPEMQGEKIAFAVPELSNSGANHEVDTICVANRHFQGEAKKKSAVRSAAPDFVIATNFSSSLSGHDDDRKKTKKKKRKVWSQRTRRRKRAKIVKLSAVPEKMTAVSNVEADVFHKSFIEGEEDSRARNNVACTTEDIQNPVLCLSDDENETNKVQEVAKADVTSELLERGSEEPQSTRTNSIVAGKFAYPSRDDPEAVEVLVSDLERLEDFVFLNDTVIDFYIMYVQREHKWPNDLKDRLHFYNSFFYKKLHEAVQSQTKEKNDRKMHNLRKWTKGINIFEKSYLFFPIHDNSHWSLAVVCLPGASNEIISPDSCFILHFDSMNNGHRSHNIYRLLKRFLVAEWEFQYGSGCNMANGEFGKSRKLQEKDIPAKRVKVPLQENDFDCGLFLLHFVDCFVKEATPTLRWSEVKNRFGKDWFLPQDASKKRETIKKIITGFLRSEPLDGQLRESTELLK